MSQQNVELARRAFDAFNRRDLSAFLAIMDDDVEAVSRVVAMEGSYLGHDGIRRWWQDLRDAFPDLMAQVVEVRDCGESTLSEVRMHGHGAGSGVPLDVTMWHVSHGREGKSIWWCFFLTEAEALEAVEVSD